MNGRKPARYRPLRRTLLAAVILAALCPVALFSQTEPESPRVVEPLRNGFQISFFSGLSLNQYTGGYFITQCPHGPCNIDFYADDFSLSTPFGASLNIPVFADAALYLRAGWNHTKVTISSGRVDSLLSRPGVGELLDELTLSYSLFQVDILVRLIGRQDGERVFLGPSFGFPIRRRAYVTESELPNGPTYLLEDVDIVGSDKMRTSIVLGAEYAFVPLKNLYVIPSFQIDYSAQKISDRQPIRPIFYKFLVSVSYQLF